MIEQVAYSMRGAVMEIDNNGRVYLRSNDLTSQGLCFLGTLDELSRIVTAANIALEIDDEDEEEEHYHV